MLPFLHDRLRTLDLLLEQSNEVLVKYNRLDLDVTSALARMLDAAIAVYRNFNDATVENRLLVLKAECVAAMQGTDPRTFERVASNRRAMQRANALRVLRTSAEQVRTDIELDMQKLTNASALLRPIVLAGIQSRLVAIPWSTPSNSHALAKLWHDLVRDTSIQLAARQVAMQVSVYDIYLLIGEILEDSEPCPA